MFNFKSKKELNKQIAELRKRNADLGIENDNLKLSIERHREITRDLRSEIEEEHLENYNQHKKLLAIERIVNKPFGSYKNALNTIKEIKRELADGNLN